MSREVVALCEGWDDRAFWAGWLVRLGCTDLGRGARDLEGKRVEGGQFALRAPHGDLVRIVPYHGLPKLLADFLVVVKRAAPGPVRAIILNRDADDPVAGEDNALRSLEGLIRRHDPNATPHPAGGYQAGALRLLPVLWTSPDPAGLTGIPDPQTLERLAACAIREADPDRAASVARWLADPPCPEHAGPKHHALSYLAKWYAEHGAQDFYKALWRDDAVAAGLERRLRATGAWEQVEALLAEA